MEEAQACKLLLKLPLYLLPTSMLDQDRTGNPRHYTSHPPLQVCQEDELKHHSNHQDEGLGRSLPISQHAPVDIGVQVQSVEG
jgi:hypothetical protein